MERIPAEAWRPREIGELNFQERVLEEALRLDYPVLERCRFLGIAAAQMDEFWAVRAPSIAGHKHIRRWRRAAEKCDRLFSRMEEGWLQLQPLLQRAGILLCEWAELSHAEQEQMLELYQREWEPSMRRLPVDRTEDWPGGTVCFLVRKGIHAAAEIVSFSYGSSALMSLPGTVGCRFLSRHELCRRGLQAQGWRVEGAFRPVREAKGLLLRPGEDLSRAVEELHHARTHGRILAVIGDTEITTWGKEALCSLPNEPVYVSGTTAPLDLEIYTQLSGWDARYRLPSLVSRRTADWRGWDDPFAAIEERDRLLHHPYDDFGQVIAFLKTAATDPAVEEIWQTLYRIGEDSPIAQALMEAAHRGKRVTVVLEIQARFDEETNRKWAQRLSEAGCRVIAGLPEHKVHAKLALVVRRQGTVRRRYVHLSTGNYHAGTARQYTDIGLFTCRPEWGEEAEALFRRLAGEEIPWPQHRLITAPQYLRAFFCRKIETERDNARQGLPSGIFAKINALTDPAIGAALCRAAQAGVSVTLMVRGACCLLPDLPGISTSIRVVSIVGQLLEHSRIFCFENAGKRERFLGSADWMPRNLDRRVEVVFPIEDERLGRRLDSWIARMLADTTQMWELHADGRYRRRSIYEPRRNCQQELAAAIDQEAGETSGQDRPVHIYP